MQAEFKIKQGKYISRVPVEIDVVANAYRIQSGYHPGLLEELRAMKGALWKPEGEDRDFEPKHWKIPVCERNDFALRYLGGYRPELSSDVTVLRYSDRPLYDHQWLAVNFIINRQASLIAYEMGLGKTLIGIEAIEQLGREFQRFVGPLRSWLVAPPGAQAEWKRQLKHWDAEFELEETTTYESLHKLLDAHEVPPNVVIFDESIKIKNPSAQRSHYAYELCRLMREYNRTHHYPIYIILFSGAPAPKDPGDWWHQIECIFPGWIKQGDVHKFRNHYGIIEMQDGPYGRYPKLLGWKEDELAKLGKRLSPLVIRRTKAECLDLPDKIFDDIQTECPSDIRSAASIICDSAETALQALEGLRQLSDGFQYSVIEDDRVPDGAPKRNTTWVGSPKIQVVKDLLDFYRIENGGCGRLVIFAAYHAAIDRLVDLCNEEGWKAYEVSGKSRVTPDVLSEFNTTGTETNCALVCNPSCVHGLSLGTTDCLVYYSNSFSTDAYIQSLDRADRLDTKRKRGTRIVNILNLETDKYILDKLRDEIHIQSITLEEIRQCLRSM